MTFAGRYPWEYFSSIPADDACMTLMEAKNRRNDDMIFYRWILGHYDYEMSLEDFKAALRPHEKRSEESILKDTFGYIEQFNQGFKQVDINGNI